MEYGLIGGRLGHSYSKVIHEMLCGYRYDLCPLPTEEEVRAFMTRRQFRAINVTIPYKLVVMEYCSYIDPHARAINAVNTIVNRNGLLYGYNTDYLGFAHGLVLRAIRNDRLDRLVPGAEITIFQKMHELQQVRGQAGFFRRGGQQAF